jgi:hypothetical protein
VALEAQATAAKGFFSLYANLLSEDARFFWDKIVSSQVGAAPWMCGKSMESFQDCITFHLLDMLPDNAAKQQRF